MVLQAFIDDSQDEDGTFVLAGHVATAESCVKFSKEWKQMLPHGTLRKDGVWHFKMKEMNETSERMARVPGFYRILEEHALLSVSCALHPSIVQRVKERVWVPGANIDLGLKKCFHAGMENFAGYLPPGSR